MPPKKKLIEVSLLQGGRVGSKTHSKNWALHLFIGYNTAGRDKNGC